MFVYISSSCVIHVYVICCQLVCLLIMYVYCMYLSCICPVFVLYVFVLEARKNGPMAELPFQVKESKKKKKKKKKKTYPPPSYDLLGSLLVARNGIKLKLIYDFLSIINSNYDRISGLVFVIYGQLNIHDLGMTF